MSQRAGREPEIFVFLLVPGLSLMSLASAVEPLRALNRLCGREAYQWRLASLDGPPVAASSGIVVPALRAEEALADADYLFVCGGLHVQPAEERRYLALLRRAARRGVSMGSLSTGTFLLARAGLLKATAAPSIGRANRLSRRNSPIFSAPARSTRSTATVSPARAAPPPWT
jgi:transcriptional regulator GlxA family with amidase domain